MTSYVCKINFCQFWIVIYNAKDGEMVDCPVHGETMEIKDRPDVLKNG